MEFIWLGINETFYRKADLFKGTNNNKRERRGERCKKPKALLDPTVEERLDR